jgi:plastocyanin
MTRKAAPGIARWRVWVTLVALVLFNISCFSDRSATAPRDEEGDCRIPASAIGANKTVVAVRDFNFFPDTVRVRPGTDVIWVNCETTVNDFHTATSQSGMWDSGVINRGEAYTRRFDSTGQFGYFCEPHPFMRGAVIVQ